MVGASLSRDRGDVYLGVGFRTRGQRCGLGIHRTRVLNIRNEFICDTITEQSANPSSDQLRVASEQHGESVLPTNRMYPVYSKAADLSRRVAEFRRARRPCRYHQEKRGDIAKRFESHAIAWKTEEGDYQPASEISMNHCDNH